MKAHIITLQYIDHLGQARKSTRVTSEDHLAQELENARLEGYTIVSVEERK